MKCSCGCQTCDKRELRTEFVHRSIDRLGTGKEFNRLGTLIKCASNLFYLKTSYLVHFAYIPGTMDNIYLSSTWNLKSACTGCANWNMPQEQNSLSIMMVTTLYINKCHYAFTHSQFSSSRFTHTTFSTHGATHNWNNSNAESNTRKNNFLPLLLHIIYVLSQEKK